MLPNVEIILRLILAAFLGSLIGLERERLLWAPGLRTHMLVCVGSCLMMIVSAFSFFDILGTNNVVLDPSRVAAQVVSGIGFLGAGVILFRSDVIRGLTTAASIWTVAGIGLAVGGGLYIAAFAATAIILIILAGIKPLEAKIEAKNNSCTTLHIKAKRGEMSINVLQEYIGNRTTSIKQFIIQTDESRDYDNIDIMLGSVRRKTVLEIIESLRKIPCVIEVKEDHASCHYKSLKLAIDSQSFLKNLD